MSDDQHDEFSEWDDETMRDEVDCWMENVPAAYAMAKVSAMLAMTVDDMLGRALRGGRVPACMCINDLRSVARTTAGVAVPPEGSRERTVFICPFHPKQLLCDRCVPGHYKREHHGEYETTSCFTCTASPITAEFTPVVAQITLLKPLPIVMPARTNALYTGELFTLPVSYLCPRHAQLLELPLEMSWPKEPEKPLTVPAPPPPPPPPRA